MTPHAKRGGDKKSMREYLEFGYLMGETVADTQRQLELNQQRDVVMDQKSLDYLDYLKQQEKPYETLQEEFDALAIGTQIVRDSAKLAKNRNRVADISEQVPEDPFRKMRGLASGTRSTVGPVARVLTAEERAELSNASYQQWRTKVQTLLTKNKNRVYFDANALEALDATRQWVEVDPITGEELMLTRPSKPDMDKLEELRKKFTASSKIKDKRDVKVLVAEDGFNYRTAVSSDNIDSEARRTTVEEHADIVSGAKRDAKRDRQFRNKQEAEQVQAAKKAAKSAAATPGPSPAAAATATQKSVSAAATPLGSFGAFLQRAGITEDLVATSSTPSRPQSTPKKQPGASTTAGGARAPSNLPAPATKADLVKALEDITGRPLPGATQLSLQAVIDRLQSVVGLKSSQQALQWGQRYRDGLIGEAEMRGLQARVRTQDAVEGRAAAGAGTSRAGAPERRKPAEPRSEPQVDAGGREDRVVDRFMKRRPTDVLEIEKLGVAADLMRSGELVEARVISANAGGCVVVTERDAVRGFLPLSQLSMKLLNINWKTIKTAKQKKDAMTAGMKALVGQSFEVMMRDFDEENRLVVFSQRAAQRQRRREALELEDAMEDMDLMESDQGMDADAEE